MSPLGQDLALPRESISPDNLEIVLNQNYLSDSDQFIQGTPRMKSMFRLS